MEKAGTPQKTLGKPLPQILDEIDDSIRFANEATKDARQAAEEARRTGEKAANEARKAAEVAVAKVREEAIKTINALGVRVSTLETEVAAQAKLVGERAAESTGKATETASAKGFLIVFEKAGNNYSAYSPDMPGCIATGRTRKEVEKNIKEAIRFHIEGLTQDGAPVPEPASFTEYIEV